MIKFLIIVGIILAVFSVGILFFIPLIGTGLAAMLSLGAIGIYLIGMIIWLGIDTLKEFS